MLTKSLLLTYQWDITLDDTGSMAITANPYAVAQDVACSCSTFLGEAWYLYFSLADAVIPSSGAVDVVFQNQASGPIACPIGALNTIYRAIQGWSGITNATAGVLGNEVESRANFEYRRKQSVAGNSNNQLGAVYANVLAVSGVTGAYVTQNNTGMTVTKGFTNVSLEPHSLYVCVYGGASADIAKAIWQKLPPGPSMVGNTTYTVVGQGKWKRVGDDGSLLAVNGGALRTFQSVSDMKSYAVESGRVYETSGYYTPGDGGGAFYVASSTGATPDGYGDHVASNGKFLRLISEPNDLNHGVIVNSTYVPATAWNNRNAIQSMLRNERWSNFKIKAQGVLYHLGSTHVGRDNISLHIMKGCKIIGRYDDPSIPNSKTSQSGGMIVFAHFFNPDNGDFIPWRDGDTRVNARVYNVHVIMDGEVSTEYNAIHSSAYNNNCLAFLKASNCSVTGSGGIGGSDHRGINFDGIDTNAPNGSDNRGGSINCRIDVGYSTNVVDNHLMIFGDNNSISTNSVKVGFLGPMLTGGYNSPIGVRVTNANVFNIEIGAFNGDNVIKPALVASYSATDVRIKVGYVNGASKILYQNETLFSDVEASQIYNTPIGIERAGTATGRMRYASLHDVRYTDTNFSYAYYSNNNADGFFRLKIKDNFFGNASASFAYYGNRVPAGMPTKMDISDNISPSSMTVVEFNQLPQSQSANLITVGATSAVINYKTPDWNYSKMTVIAQASGVYGACEIDIRTRIITSQNVAYSAGAITVNTALSGNNITITLSAGAALALVTMHN